jgi:glycosyltransferase involved in cell wall biosynthesis
MTDRMVAFVVPGPLGTLTGGYGYDRSIVDGLRRLGWSVVTRELTGSYPMPSTADRAAAARVLADLPDAALVIVDGLALGALPSEAERERGRLRIVALVHHPLADETGLDADTRSRLAASERRALACARHVVVTSAPTARLLAAYDVEPARVSVVEPGTHPAPLARGSQTGCIAMLCVATLTPRKGHALLFRALAAIRDAEWTLTCVGSRELDPMLTTRLRAELQSLGVAGRVSLPGEMVGDALAARYDAADVFVLATHFEGYGMAVAEALARGLPVISTTTGAIPALVGDNAGLLVPPGDGDAFARALRQFVDDASLRRRLSDGARAVRASLPTWDDAARKMAQVMASVAGDR